MEAWRKTSQIAEMMNNSEKSEHALVAFLKAWSIAPNAATKQISMTNARLCFEKIYGFNVSYLTSFLNDVVHQNTLIDFIECQSNRNGFDIVVFGRFSFALARKLEEMNEMNKVIAFIEGSTPLLHLTTLNMAKSCQESVGWRTTTVPPTATRNRMIVWEPFPYDVINSTYLRKLGNMIHTENEECQITEVCPRWVVIRGCLVESKAIVDTNYVGITTLNTGVDDATKSGGAEDAILQDSISPHEVTCGFDLRRFNSLSPCARSIVLDDFKDHVKLSEPFIAWELDLHSIDNQCDTVNWMSGQGKSISEVKVVKSGRVDCVVLWLDTHLTPPIGNEETKVWSCAPSSLRNEHRPDAPLHEWQIAHFIQSSNDQDSNMQDVGVEVTAESTVNIETLMGEKGVAVSLSKPDELASLVPETLDYHSSMMNDQIRNEAYNLAIQRAVTNIVTRKKRKQTVMEEKIDVSVKQPIVRVMDIGSGSGLLGMMAARAIKENGGISDVVCCEKVFNIANISLEILEENQLDDSVRVANAYSSEIELPMINWGGEEAQDITSEKYMNNVKKNGADLLVTEIYGDQPLSESVLLTMQHAKQHLLNKNCVCVPAAFRVMAALIIAPPWLVQQTSLSPASQVAGTASSAEEVSSSLYNDTLHELVSTEVPLTTANAENLDWVTEPVELFGIQMITPSLLGDYSVEMTKKRHALSEDPSGLAIVHWFELDMDKESVLSTAPVSLSTQDELGRNAGKTVTRATCWKQNVMHLPDLSAKNAQSFTARARYHKDKLVIGVTAN